MSNQLTDRQFWSSYWESKTDLAFPVGRNYLFYKQLEELIERDSPKTAIELGGFPGYYAIFLKKYFGIQTTLLDYFIHPSIINEVLEVNHLSPFDIDQVEADLFNYHPEEQYDLVLSCGLIEHFEDTEDILRRHVQLLKPGGTLFITLPNFKGTNGWVQRTFDPENYGKHNVKCMDPVLLASLATKLGLKHVRSGYAGKFSVWLENKAEKSTVVKAFVRTIWAAGKVATRIVPVESRVFSPYIVLEARN